MTVVWQAIGWASLALGSLGVILPLLPTTPFLLLSAWCFARSSPRFHDSLIQHPRLGPPIEAWRSDGAISRPPKPSRCSRWRPVLPLPWLPGWALAVQGTCLGAVTLFILTRPELG